MATVPATWPHPLPGQFEPEADEHEHTHERYTYSRSPFAGTPSRRSVCECGEAFGLPETYWEEDLDDFFNE